MANEEKRNDQPAGAVPAGYDRQPASTSGSRENNPARPTPDGAAQPSEVHRVSEPKPAGKPAKAQDDALRPHGTHGERDSASGGH